MCPHSSFLLLDHCIYIYIYACTCIYIYWSQIHPIIIFNSFICCIFLYALSYFHVIMWFLLLFIDIHLDCVDKICFTCKTQANHFGQKAVMNLDLDSGEARCLLGWEIFFGVPLLGYHVTQLRPQIPPRRGLFSWNLSVLYCFLSITTTKLQLNCRNCKLKIVVMILPWLIIDLYPLWG